MFESPFSFVFLESKFSTYSKSKTPTHYNSYSSHVETYIFSPIYRVPHPLIHSSPLTTKHHPSHISLYIQHSSTLIHSKSHLVPQLLGGRPCCALCCHCSRCCLSFISMFYSSYYCVIANMRG